MKRKSFLHATLVCFLCLYLVACDKDNPDVEESIPAVVKSNFLDRYPNADITVSRIDQIGPSFSELWQIDFKDDAQNQATAWYRVDGTWKMTYTELQHIADLPDEVQRTFGRSIYRDAQIKTIHKTERDGMTNTLYTLYFQFTTRLASNVEHYVFINDDGLFLTKFTWTPNDPVRFVNLPEDHFDFISTTYKGAEIRGYANNSGVHEYFILHEGSIKYVFFDGITATESYFWKETRYELPADTVVPDNVIQRLKKASPDFTYTNLYYIEAKQGNQYLFMDMNRADELGWYIDEDV